LEFEGAVELQFKVSSSLLLGCIAGDIRINFRVLEDGRKEFCCECEATVGERCHDRFSAYATSWASAKYTLKNAKCNFICTLVF